MFSSYLFILVITLGGINCSFFFFKIKPGTQSGETSTLRGKGITRKGRFDVGNQILTWKVSVPSGTALPEDQRELFAQLKEKEPKLNPFQLE